MEEQQKRLTMIEKLKNKRIEISTCMEEGVEDARLQDLLDEYIVANDIAQLASEIKSDIPATIKEESHDLFNVHDSILEQFIELGDHIVTVCSEGEQRVSGKASHSRFIDTLAEAIPAYVSIVESMMKVNKDISELDIKPRSDFKNHDEGLLESIDALTEQYEKVSKYINSITRAFSKRLPKVTNHNEKLKENINSLYEEIIVEDSLTGDHYCIVQPKFAIFGVGRTENEAWADAEEWADTTDENWKQSFEVKPCTKAVYDYVSSQGTPDDWEEENGTIALSDEISEMKEKIKESKIHNK